MSEPFRFPTIETARLRLRLLALDDADALYRHFSDDEVTHFMDIDALKSLDEARDVIAFHLNDSGCRWGVFDKISGALIGTCGYHCWIQGENARAEIGYDLGKAHWGQGLMIEAVKPVIDFGFKTMGLQRIEADVEPDNHRSIQLLARLGFQELPEKLGPLPWFALPRTDWERRI